METIKVNMTPCEDIKTIHASQNDNEAREWGFELHNNGDVIDASEITDQLVFKAYKGGTEQLLPENTSTPTTTPILADIQYPDGLRTDQYFTYRETPTTVSNKARIKTIKGNTLVWNQLVQNGNFESSSGWNGNNATVSIADNKCNVTVAVASTSSALRNAGINGISGHKYLGIMTVTSPKATSCAFYLSGVASEASSVPANIRTVVYGILTPSSNTGGSYFYINRNAQLSVGDTVVVENVMFLDLTQMGLDITDPSEFTSLFPLPYYAYNQGTLLSFNGNGIKTTGKNLIDPSLIEYQKNWDGSIITSRAVCYLSLPYGTYTFSIQDMGTLAEVSVSVTAEKYGQRYSLGNLTNSTKSRTVTINADRPYAQFLLRVASGTITQTDFESCHLMIESGSTATDYEPYTESTLSLPISTYFSNGMKSAGSVYDELTETKAITRVGSRAYQSGDESDTSVITDGTTTYYALATPTETSFTTASLVTENAEIPLSAENDVLIGKCTEELSAEPGFHDAKIKLTDSDGTCYSNKIQLHVERSPQ